MNIEQAFGNMIAGCAVAQESGRLNLDQAAAIVESIRIVRSELGLNKKPEAAPPAAES